MWLATDRDERGATSHMRRTGIGVRLRGENFCSYIFCGVIRERQPPTLPSRHVPGVHQLERTLLHILSRNRVDLQGKSSFYI